MSRTEDELTANIDSDFRNVIQKMIDFFVVVSAGVRGRGTHTTGIAARGMARIVTTVDFPPNAFLRFGDVYPVVVRHATPRSAFAGRDKDGQVIVDTDDRVLDGGAMSVKFLRADDRDGLGFHDLMMNTGRVLFVRSAAAFNTMIHTPFGQRAPLLRSKGKEDWVIDDDKLTEAYRTGSFTEFYYHSQIAYEFTDSSGTTRYIKFRSIPGDRGPERGFFPQDIRAGGDTFSPRWQDDHRAEDFRRTDFETRVNHLGVDYILQAQLHPSGDTDALNPAEYWEERYHPWLDIAQIHLTRTLNHDEMDALEFDANRTHDCINLPLARTADDYASMGHARALIYWKARQARRGATSPHRV